MTTNVPRPKSTPKLGTESALNKIHAKIISVVSEMMVDDSIAAIFPIELWNLVSEFFDEVEYPMLHTLSIFVHSPRRPRKFSIDPPPKILTELGLRPPALCDEAAALDNCAVVDWAHRRGYKWGCSTTAAAAAAGHLNMLMFLRGHGCEW